MVKFMFKRLDEEFDEMAADAARRREGIVSLTSRRDVLCWCAVIMTLVALPFFFTNRSPAGAAAIGFAAAVQWMLLFKFESDLRLLRVVERLHRVGNEQTKS
jgi:hypothetical protein